MSITPHRLGEGWVEHMDRVAAPQNMVGTEVLIRKPSIPFFSPAAVDPVDPRRKTVSLLRLRPSTGLRSLSQSRLAPTGDSSPSMLVGVSECPAQALFPNCPPSTLTHAANSDPSLSSSPPNDPSDTCPTRRYGSMHGVSSLAEREILTRVYIQCFQKPSQLRLPDNC
jgi:hypothetical protein